MVFSPICWSCSLVLKWSSVPFHGLVPQSSYCSCSLFFLNPVAQCCYCSYALVLKLVIVCSPVPLSCSSNFAIVHVLESWNYSLYSVLFLGSIPQLCCSLVLKLVMVFSPVSVSMLLFMFFSPEIIHALKSRLWVLLLSHVIFQIFLFLGSISQLCCSLVLKLVMVFSPVSVSMLLFMFFSPEIIHALKSRLWVLLLSHVIFQILSPVPWSHFSVILLLRMRSSVPFLAPVPQSCYCACSLGLKLFMVFSPVAWSCSSVLLLFMFLSP